MKKILLLTLLLSSVLTMSAKIDVTRIDPADWFVGMKNPQLQLMVYGKGVCIDLPSSLLTLQTLT